MRTKPALILLLFLSSCVSATLGNHDDIEEYSLREASEAEGKGLKRCLQAAHHFQTQKKAKQGKYFRKVSEMPLDPYCQDYLLAQSATPEGYEITAQFHSGESTVRWSVNQDGVIEEHLGGEMDGEEDFF